jgi:hypothetical protein
MARPDRIGVSNPRWLAMQAKQSILVSGGSRAATAPNQERRISTNRATGLRSPPVTYPNSLLSLKSTSSRSM